MSSGFSYPTRKLLRLQNYDYHSAGVYFVTINVQDRLPLFGLVEDGVTQLTNAGLMVWEVWNELPGHYLGVALDEAMVMPDHMHGLLVLTATEEGRNASSLSLAEVVQRFKSLSTTRYIRGVKERGWPPFAGRLWLRSYYDRVIRSDRELDAAREYISTNPPRWEMKRRGGG